MFKPIRMSDYTTAISVEDPAIDHEATGKENFEKFSMERIKKPSCFRDYIKEKAGEKLTVFEIGVITPDDMARINDECISTSKDHRWHELYWRCFLSGLRGIDGFGDNIPKQKRNGIEYVDPEFLRKSFIRGLRDVAREVGAQIWAWNQITEEETKN